MFKDYIHLHFIVLIWGFSGVMGKLVSIPSIELVFYRTFISAVGLLLILFILKKPVITSSKVDLKRMFFMGFLVAVHWVLFFLSARLANVSVSLAGMATGALWTSLVESLNRKVKSHEIILGSISFLGMVIIFQSDLSYGYGFLIAVVSAFFCAIFTVGNAGLVKRQDPITITFYEMVFASLILLVTAPIFNVFFGKQLFALPEVMDWVYLLVLACFCTIYAFTVSVELMKRLTAFAINLTVNLEPIYGMGIAFVIFGHSEKMKLDFYLGTILILISVLIFPSLNKKYNKKKHS